MQAPQDIRISLVGEFSEIANAQAAIGATPEYIAIVFRGTQEGADWITNLKFFHKDFPKLGRVHKVEPFAPSCLFVCLLLKYMLMIAFVCLCILYWYEVGMLKVPGNH